MIANKAKDETFFLNGKELPITSYTLSYEDIVELFCNNRALTPTVLYTRSNSKNPNGLLIRGESVKLKNGTDISVAFTGNA